MFSLSGFFHKQQNKYLFVKWVLQGVIFYCVIKQHTAWNFCIFHGFGSLFVVARRRVSVTDKETKL